MDWKKVGGALCCSVTAIIIVLVIVCSIFGPSTRTNSITSSAPITLDQHDESNIVKIQGSNTVLIVLVAVFAVSTSIGVCSFVFHYCKYRHLPRRRAARQAALAQQEQQLRLAALCQQLLPGCSAPNPAVQPDMPMARLPPRGEPSVFPADSSAYPAEATGRDYFR
jgi:hypothetical protein